MCNWRIRNGEEEDRKRRTEIINKIMAKMVGGGGKKINQGSSLPSLETRKKTLQIKPKASRSKKTVKNRNQGNRKQKPKHSSLKKI